MVDRISLEELEPEPERSSAKQALIDKISFSVEPNNTNHTVSDKIGTSYISGA